MGAQRQVCHIPKGVIKPSQRTWPKSDQRQWKRVENYRMGTVGTGWLEGTWRCSGRDTFLWLLLTADMGLASTFKGLD